MNHSLRRRKAVDVVMLGLCGLGALLAVITLLAILGYAIGKGLPAISLRFLVSLPQPVGEPGGGIANAIVGTTVLVALACIIGIPIGLLAGIYVSEFARPSVAVGVRFVADVLFGVPSIVTGVFVYGLVVVSMGAYSALAGGIALAFIIVPIIARTAEESLKLVPNTLREAGLALGVPLWRTILSVVLPSALPGVMTGIILGLARVTGETAPLIFTAFGSRLYYQGLDEPIAALPLQIYRYAISPYDDWQRQAWGAALILIIMVLFASVGIRIITGKRFRGAS